MAKTVGINLQPVSDQTPGILNRITGPNKVLCTSSDGKAIELIDKASIGGTSTAVKDRSARTLTARTAFRVLGAAARDNGTVTTTDLDLGRCAMTEFGANPNGRVATTITATAGSTSPVVASAANLSVGNWLRCYGGAGADHGMGTPGAPTVVVQGTTGATTYSVKVVAVTLTRGYTAASAATNVTTGNAALSSTNFLEVWAPSVAGAAWYLAYVQVGGSGAYNYAGACIAHPQFDEDNIAFPMSIRIDAASKTPPPELPATAPASAQFNSLLTQVTAINGTTLTVSPAIKTAVTGALCEVCNVVPFENAMADNASGLATENRIDAGAYHITTELEVRRPAYLYGPNGGLHVSSAIILRKQGAGVSLTGAYNARQWQPGAQTRLGDAVTATTRTGITGAWFATAIAAGAAWGYTSTTEPTWSYTIGGTTTDGDVTWTFQQNPNSAFGAVLEAISIRCADSVETLPAARHYAPDDLRVSVRYLAAAVWLPTTVIGNGFFCRPTAANLTGKIYRCTVGGTTSGAEPTWPRVNGATVVDGTVTWTCYDCNWRQGAALMQTAPTHLERFQIDGAMGMGWFVVGSGVNGTNADGSTCYVGDIRNITGIGMMVRGNDGQVGVFEKIKFGVKVAGGSGTALADSSFYGNHYVGCETQGNSRYQNSPWVDSVQYHFMLDHCYTEGGVGGELDVNAPGAALRGLHGAGRRTAGPVYGEPCCTGQLINFGDASNLGFPFNSPVLELDTSTGQFNRKLVNGVERYQWGPTSGSVAATTLIQEEYSKNTGLTRTQRLTGTIGSFASEQTIHYGARQGSKVFPNGAQFGGNGTYASERIINAVSAIPTTGCFAPGDYLIWSTDRRRKGFRFQALGAIGTPSARANSTLYAMGAVMQSGGRIFVAANLLSATTAGSLPAGLATAAGGDYILDGGVSWFCWCVGVTNCGMVAEPHLDCDPVSVTDADHLVAGTGGLGGADGPCFTFAAQTANRSLDVLTTGAANGDKVSFVQSNNVAFTQTLNNTGGGGGSFVLPVNTPCKICLRFDGTNWALDTFAPFAIAPRLNPIRTFSGTTDAPTAADQAGNVDSTGASPAAITLNTLPKGTCITYSGSGAGLLSFVNGTATLETALPSSGATTAQHQTRTLFWRTATNVRIT